MLVCLLLRECGMNSARSRKWRTMSVGVDAFLTTEKKHIAQQLVDGSSILALNVSDGFNRDGLGIEVNFSLPS